jgi:predicted nucleic-acid-binding protein
MFRSLRSLRKSSVTLAGARNSSGSSGSSTSSSTGDSTEKNWKSSLEENHKLLQVVAGITAVVGTCIYFVLSHQKRIEVEMMAQQKNIIIAENKIIIAQKDAELTAMKAIFKYSNTEEFANMRQANNMKELQEKGASGAKD